jgi:predicted TIM-barrel fold metal-dependent hydrolase
VIEAHKHVAAERFVGVRMILNYSPEDPSLTWPQVERGDYLTGGVPSFKEGFALLAPRGLSFDLQVNWFQLQDAATFLQAFPETVVVVDHLGCLKLGVGDEEDAKRIAVWQEGMKALAALPNVYVKLSMLEYMRPGWQHKGTGGATVETTTSEAAAAGMEVEKEASESSTGRSSSEVVATPTSSTDANAVVKARVREVIEWFGPERCMFASNFPVDKCLLGGSAQPTTLEALVLAQHALIHDLPEEQQRQLFSETAKKVYKLK